jgi:opacity protein-like surface antigen
MKSKVTFLGAALLILCTGAASAGTNMIGINGGAGIPTGDYGDAAGNGWNLGVTGTHMVNDQWGFGADLGYHAWGASSDVEDALLPGEDISWTAFQANAHAMMQFPTQSNVKPFAKVGLGIYNLGFKFESPSGDLDASESKLGFNFGGGMLFSTTSNMKWGFNGAYHIVPAEEDLGSDVNFFSVGVNLLWGLSQQ